MTGMAKRGRTSIALSAVVLAAFVATPSASVAAPEPGRFTATALVPTSTITAAKSRSGRLAQSDTSLVARTDAAKVNVMVKLDYDATASYHGDLAGLAATSPSVTGRTLTGATPAEKAYDAYTAKKDRTFRANLAAKLPGAKAGQSVRQVYGGVAVRLPANQVKSLLHISGVAAVQADTLEHLDVATVESPVFIGAPTIWNKVGGQALAGRGVTFADLDTGIWPEHPSFADNKALGTPPVAPSGKPRVCDFGDNPLTPAPDVFKCNHKIIGGQPFLATYNANQPGETYPTSARDSDGHGTHTTSTAAGDVVAHAPIFGIDRGPISGVAPGAWIMEYKVCGAVGCFSSDAAAAVQQAILDGANVINFSISGGVDPYSDPVELAFLDAYNAGVLVAASAGNSGPGAGTTSHDAPWTMTVAASTQSRQFDSTLRLSGDGKTASFVGVSLTAGVTAPAPVVLAQNIPGYDALCSTPLAAGLVTGKIVACRRGTVGRVQKGHNVLAGGAAGMILYNLPLADTESDNHYLPVVHLADGTNFLAFMVAHPSATATFTAGFKANGQGDVMATFSSRGPGGQFLKPDITAPGVQVLAGNTPTPADIASGPRGQYFQAIAGTSMSSPNIAGAAILLKAQHRAWTPGDIKSAIMTTATTKVVKEDLKTAADPFDMGSGRVDLSKAGDAQIVFDETAANMANLGKNPLTAINLNLPSVNVPTMPGSVLVTRTATNVTGKTYGYSVTVKSPTGSKISVYPHSGIIRSGQSQTFEITIYSSAPSGQYFGEIDFRSGLGPALHVPVAFYDQQGDVSLTSSCNPATIAVSAMTACSLTARNSSSGEAAVVARSSVTAGLVITGATGVTLDRLDGSASVGPVILAAPKDALPAIAAGATPVVGGYLGLETLGVAPTTIGDDENLNFKVPGYVYGDKTYTAVGVDSNGYISVGGTSDPADISSVPQTFPNPAKPNGVLAPYWTHLDGTGAPGVRAGTVTNGTKTWIVVQWNTHVYGAFSAAGTRAMQVWIGVNGTQDISYAYDTSARGVGVPAGTGLTVGAENVTGTAGAQISGPPAGSYVVRSTPGHPGGSRSYSLAIQGRARGNQAVTSTLDSDLVVGTTRVRTPIIVTR
jgi:Subtilase family/Fibronectin type-III domain/PA domain